MVTSMSDYPELFRTFIINSLKHVLNQVKQGKDILTSDIREQALHTLSYAFNIPKAWPDVRELLLTLAPIMEQAGYRDEWIPYLTQGINRSEQMNDMDSSAELHLQLGILYRLRGKYEKARIHSSAALTQFTHLDSLVNQARALNCLGHVARQQQQFEEANNLIEKALNLLEYQEVERAYSYLILALIATDKRSWEETIKYSKKALDLWEGDKSNRMVARTLIVLGGGLEKTKHYDEAMSTYKQAIQLFDEIQDTTFKAIAQMNLGSVHVALKQLTEALSYYISAEQIFLQTQDIPNLSITSHNMGLAYRRLQQWNKAESSYLSSLTYKRQIGNLEGVINTLDGLGLLYFEQERFTKAIAFFEDALRQLDSHQDWSTYDYFFNMISNHLEEAIKKNSSKNFL